MSKAILRWVIWLILACCAAIDGMLGEAAILGGGDVGFVDADGKFALPLANPKLWLPIIGFVVIQGFLIFALIRLRHTSKGQPPTVFGLKN
jgi:hypothetical protein